MRRWKVYEEGLYKTSSIISWNSWALFGRMKFLPLVSSSSKNFVFTPFCILCVTMETKQNVGMYSHIILQQSTATLLASCPGWPCAFVACSTKFAQRIREFRTASDECAGPGNKARLLPSGTISVSCMGLDWE